MAMNSDPGNWIIFSPVKGGLCIKPGFNRVVGMTGDHRPLANVVEICYQGIGRKGANKAACVGIDKWFKY